MTKLPEESESFVFQAFNRADARDTELLFQARRIPYGLKIHNGVWFFFIPAHCSTRAVNELARSRNETIEEPHARSSRHEKPVHSFPHTFVLAALSLFHFYVSRSPDRLEWIKEGASSADDIIRGEWVKTITALTLHGDDAHLAGNVLFLWLLGNAVGSSLGYGTGWLLILLSGAGGNFLNAIFYQTSHNSIGASTALFGAIGIVTALKIKMNLKKPAQLTFREKYLPVVTLAALFSFIGLSPESDIMAHFFGAVFGFFSGYLSAPMTDSDLLQNNRVQMSSLALFFFIIFMAWQ